MLYNHQHKIYASAENLQKKFNCDAIGVAKMPTTSKTNLFNWSQSAVHHLIKMPIVVNEQFPKWICQLDDCQIIHNERRFFGWTTSEKKVAISSSKKDDSVWHLYQISLWKMSIISNIWCSFFIKEFFVCVHLITNITLCNTTNLKIICAFCF